jgi:hypothetical protein
MTDTDRAAFRAECVATYKASIERLEKADRSGEVLAFKQHDLTVRIIEPGKVTVCSADKATDVSGRYVAPVTNGNGDRAERVTRAEAIDTEIAGLRRLIEWAERLT